MSYEQIVSVLQILGFKEYAIALFESPEYNVIFDCNSGGLTVLDLDENGVDGVCEDATFDEFCNLIAKHVNPSARADAPWPQNGESHDITEPEGAAALAGSIKISH